ncbi:sigma-70 family RNA polymerase sigma factor [Puniceicoccaceae bacterium K14]|nr:sigma-70 family RNA polymerase sigma factor [Puniceicoccaceae bacterium K14]
MDDASKEADLIRRIAEGDRVAFDELYARYSKPLFSYALKFLRDRMQAEEVLQDVFVKIWKTAKNYNPALSRPFSWSVLVTKRLCIDKLRKRKPETLMEDPMVIAPMELHAANARSPSDSIVIAEEVGELKRMIEKLPKAQQDSLLLAMNRGMTQQEISDTLKMPLGTVKTSMRRGMQRLKQLMAQCYE